MWLNASVPEEYDLDLPTIPSDQMREVLASCPYFPTYASNRRACPRDIPIMSVEFHDHCMNKAAIPDFDTFVEDYMSNNADWLRIHASNFLEPVIARVERSYPSLVRDVYFLSVGRESGFELRRTLGMDLDGIDAVLDGRISIRLFYDSKRSRADKRRKSIAHGVPENCVDFGIRPSSSEIVGGVYLYRREDIIEFLESIKETGILEDSQEK